MLLLNSTSDLLKVVTDAAVTVDVHASFADLASGAVTPGRTNTAITTATTTTVVGSPGASTARTVKFVSIRNKHASTPVTVTVTHTDATAGVTSEMTRALLKANEQLIFTEGSGWATIDATGGVKMVSSIVDARIFISRLGSDVSNSTTTAAAISGLTLAAGIGTFYFTYMLRYQAGATTTGIKFSVNHSGTVSAFVYNTRWVDTSATAATGAPDQDVVTATGGVVSAMAARAKSTAGIGPTASVDTASADMLMIIEGMMIVTAAGNIELYHGSEVAAASSVMTGSSLVLIQTA